MSHSENKWVERLRKTVSDQRILFVILASVLAVGLITTLVLTITLFPRVTKLEHTIKSLLDSPHGAEVVLSQILPLVVPNTHPLVVTPNGANVLLRKMNTSVTMEIGPYLGIIDNSTIPETEYFSTIPFVFNTLLPVAYRPATEIYLPMTVKDKSIKSPGYARIAPTGTVTINFAGVDQLNGWGVISLIYPCSGDCDAGIINSQIHWQTEL